MFLGFNMGELLDCVFGCQRKEQNTQNSRNASLEIEAKMSCCWGFYKIYILYITYLYVYILYFYTYFMYIIYKNMFYYIYYV